MPVHAAMETTTTTTLMIKEYCICAPVVETEACTSTHLSMLFTADIFAQHHLAVVPRKKLSGTGAMWLNGQMESYRLMEITLPSLANGQSSLTQIPTEWVTLKSTETLSLRTREMLSSWRKISGSKVGLWKLVLNLHRLLTLLSYNSMVLPMPLVSLSVLTWLETKCSLWQEDLNSSVLLLELLGPD